MDKQLIFKQVEALGLLAVIRGPSEQKTLNAVEALIDAGVKGIEITFSTPNAASVMNKLAQKHGNEILLGMGTLTEEKQIEMAADNGAKFIVSPMFESSLTQAFIKSGMLTMVGCFTPSEVFRAYQMGVDIIKIFPGRLAGPNYIKDLRGPFPDIPFMPTGGVNKDNVADWFKVGVVAVGAGSSLCPKELVKCEDYYKITEIAREFVAVVDSVK